MQNDAFIAEVDGVSESEWSQAMDSFSDANIYQTWAYGNTCWSNKNTSRLVLRNGGRVVGMAQLRIVRPAWVKCGLAILRWGPLCELKGSPFEVSTLREIAEALHAEYVRRRGLLLRIIPNAAGQTPRAVAFQTAFSAFKGESFRPDQTCRTMILDLSPPLDELRKRLDQKWRNQLNRAEKNNLEFVEGDSRDLFNIFLQMYDQMVARKKFETSTDVHQFADIQRNLPKNQKMKILICRKEGVPVAGLVAAAIGDSGIYLHGATSDEGLNLKGSYLLQWRMIRWLKENGLRFYNLGGINPLVNPGVYHFKKGLSGNDVPYLQPFAACTNPMSALFAKTADFGRAGVHRGFRSAAGAIRGMISRRRRDPETAAEPART